MIKHHEGCNAAYPEKPSGEPPRHVIYGTIGKDVLATCGDCGAWERYPRTMFKDIRRDDCEALPWSGYTLSSTMGRTKMAITCPFCERHMTAYRWSLSGGGKRCDCGAILGGYGDAYKLTVAS